MGTTIKFKLDHYINSGDIKLERGKVISKITMASIPGVYPVYSSSVNADALFGKYGRYMFDEELITWSVDGGGNFFYRPKHKFSVTNVSGVLKLTSNKFIYKYLFYLLDWEHKFHTFDYVEKAHPSVIRKLYDIYEITLAEQQKISEVLTTTDEAIKKINQLIEKYKRLKQGLMQDLFRFGIDQYGQMRTEKTHQFKDSPLGRIPEEWSLYTIQDLLDRNYILSHLDGNHGELYPRSYEFREEGIPYISANDFSEGKVDFSTCKFLSEERAKKFKKGIAKDGDVLFAHNATVGPVALLKTSLDYVILSTTATYFRCNDAKLSNFFLAYELETSLFVRQYQAVMKQSTRSQVPITAQRKFSLVLPEVAEQTYIAATLSSVDEAIEIEENYKYKLLAIKQGLMDDVLLGKVSIKNLVN